MVASIFVAFVALIVVVEPLGVVPYFMTQTRDRPAADARRIAARASIVGALILLGFAVFGGAVLAGLGLRLDAFRVAGGLVLLLTGLDMIRQKAASACRCSPAEATGTGDDGSIVPLAIPLLSGPGAMAATLGLVGTHPTLAVAIAIVLVFAVTYGVLRTSTVLGRLVGPAALSVIQRVLGLLLAAMSVQSIVTGIAALWATRLA